MKIAIVTREFSGLDSNGGIGTAVRYLCEHLAFHGEYEVHVYYTGRPGLRMPRLKQCMRQRGITIHSLPLFAHSIVRDWERTPGYVYDALRPARHDMLIFHEFMADGFFCLRAKKNGEAFAGVPVGIVTHGSSLWVDEGNGRTGFATPRDRLYGMEKTCCELADFLVSPSEYLVDWMRGHEWKLPDMTFCIPNFVSPPGARSLPAPRKHLTGQAIREIVFFGRLEERKGVRIFCDALNLLPVSALNGRAVTFLGKQDHFSAKAIRSWLSPTLGASKVALRFISDYDSLEARQYLSREGVLAVMPSLRENSPCTVSECLELGIPFIASSEGGGKELVIAAERETTFFPPRKEDLSKRLLAVISNEGKNASHSSWKEEDIYKSWQSVIQNGMATCP